MHEKLFNITNPQKNANQNHNKLPPHTHQNGYYQKDNKQQMLAKMWTKGNLHVLMVEMSIGAIATDSSMEVPQKLKVKL